MENLFIYGGFILTAGKLNDGTPWKGVRILLAPIKTADEVPVSAEACKGRQTDGLVSSCRKLAIGQPCTANFDMKGRVISLAPLPTR